MLEAFKNFLKGALLSKTVWAAAALAFFGTIAKPLQDWTSVHPGVASVLVSAVFATFRAFTTESLMNKGTNAS